MLRKASYCFISSESHLCHLPCTPYGYIKGLVPLFHEPSTSLVGSVSFGIALRKQANLMYGCKLTSLLNDGLLAYVKGEDSSRAAVDLLQRLGVIETLQGFFLEFSWESDREAAITLETGESSFGLKQ